MTTTAEVIYIVLIIVGLIAILGGSLIFHAWYAVRRQPTKPMMYCPTHGPLTERQTITFIDTPYCFMCWHMKTKQ